MQASRAGVVEGRARGTEGAIGDVPGPNLQRDQGAQRHAETRRARRIAAIDEGPNPDRLGAARSHEVDDLGGRPSGRDDVLHYQGALARVKLETTPKRHLVVASFGEHEPRARGERSAKPKYNRADRGGRDRIELPVERARYRIAEALREAGMLKYAEFLHKNIRVSAR